MATLWITEYVRMADDGRSRPLMAGEEPAVAIQSVAYTSSTQSAALHDSTRFVRLKSDADAYVVFGENPVATVASTPIEADVAEYFGVGFVKNRQLKIAAYDGTT